MAKKTLNLGSILSQLIKDANANFDELYNTLANLQANDGIHAVVYSNISNMLTGLNGGTDEQNQTLDIVVGSEIYILDDDTPDFWVAKVHEGYEEGQIPVDENGNANWEKNIKYRFGKYSIMVSKNSEVDLADYQRISNLVTSIDIYSTHEQYPSAKAVLETIVSRLATFSNNYATKDELAKAGKVKSVSINKGTPATPDPNGNIDLDLSSISIDVDELMGDYADVTPQTVTINGKTYTAIVLDDTDVTLELLNSNGEAVITQQIRANDKLYYVLSDGDTNTYTIRKVGGNAVGGGNSNNAKTVDLYQHFVIFQIPVSFNYNTVTHNATAFVPLSFVSKYPAVWSGLINIASNGMSTCGGHIAFESEDPEDSFKFSKFGIVTSFSLSYNSEAGILTCSLFGKILKRTEASIIESIGFNYIPVSKTMELNGNNLFSQSVSKFTLEVT